MSPSGVEAFQRKRQAKEQRKAQYGGDWVRADYFGIDANQYAILRFLEQGEEITFSDVHRVPVEGRRYPADFICLDSKDDGTPCPGCQSADKEIAKRSTKGYLNVIWREGPVYKRNENGVPEKGPDKKPVLVGRADGVFLWKCSWTVLEALLEKDGKYKGLMSRDFEVKRTGSGLQDTKYHLEPADPDGGPHPMLITDLALAEKKYDLAALTRPMSFEEFAAVLSSGAMPPGQGPQKTFDRSSVLPTAQTTFTGEPSVRASAFAQPSGFTRG